MKGSEMYCMKCIWNVNLAYSVVKSETFWVFFKHCKYYYVLEHEEEQLMMEFSEFSAKVPIP